MSKNCETGEIKLEKLAHINQNFFTEIDEIEQKFWNMQDLTWIWDELRKQWSVNRRHNYNIQLEQFD